MSSARRILDMECALDGDPTSAYQASIVSWLPGQLPGHDMRNVGWGLLVLAVDATPRPQRSGPNSAVNSGMRSVMLNAGKVGSALIDSPGPVAESPPDVGWDLADLRPAMAEVVREVTAVLPPDADIAQATGEAPAILRDLFPDADVAGTGWAALGTAMVLAKEAKEVQSKITRGHMRRRTREHREQWGNGAIFAAIILGRLGDLLISES